MSTRETSEDKTPEGEEQTSPENVVSTDNVTINDIIPLSPISRLHSSLTNLSILQDSDTLVYYSTDNVFSTPASTISGRTVTESQVNLNKRLPATPLLFNSELALTRKRKRHNSLFNLSDEIADLSLVDPITVMAKKAVTFKLQGPKTDDTQAAGPSLPAAPTLPEDQPEDPSRTYQVIPEAADVWRLGLGSLRSAARNHERAASLQAHLDTESAPLWSYGLQPVPDYLKPLPTDIIQTIHRCATSITSNAHTILVERSQADQRKANRMLEGVKNIYDEEQNSEYALAEQRMIGIAGFHRTKERGIQAKHRAKDASDRPQDPSQWKELLSTRSAKRNTAQPTGRRRSRSRSRSRSRDRRQGGQRHRGTVTSTATSNNQPPPPPPGAGARRGKQNQRGGSKPAPKRGPSDLSPEEQAVIAAMRKSTKKPK